MRLPAAEPFFPRIPGFRVEGARGYWLGERRLPGVTDVLRAVGALSAPPDGRYAAYGQRVAQLLLAAETGQPLEGVSADLLDGYLAAWRRWCSGTGCQVIAAEEPVCNPEAGYAGRLDRLVLTRSGPLLVEIKAGLPAAWHRIQAAAYLRCLRDVTDAVCVYLSPSGECETRPVTARDICFWLDAIRRFGGKQWMPS